MSKIAKKANPELWERCKEEALQKMDGRFSARAMQYAVRRYKEQGGEYLEPKTSQNSLTQWAKEEKSKKNNTLM